VTAPALAHDTVRLDRTFAHPPQRLFAAYADATQRARWSAPSDDEFVRFTSDDFRVGGTDEFVCGLRADPTADGTTFHGLTRYEAIDRDRHIVFTERLCDQTGGLVMMSLVTWSMAPTTHGCELAIVDQITSFAGDGPITGSRHGYTAALDRLAHHLDADPGAAPR